MQAVYDGCCVNCNACGTAQLSIMQKLRYMCRLYNTSYKAPSQLYMLLIITLILSQDSGFCQNIQEVALPSVPWYKERLLQKTSLGTWQYSPFGCSIRRLDTCSFFVVSC